MGGSGTSLRVGLELVLRIEPEFGVVTRSCNTGAYSHSLANEDPHNVGLCVLYSK